jgi:hypothetical protein
MISLRSGSQSLDLYKVENIRNLEYKNYSKFKVVN